MCAVLWNNPSATYSVANIPVCINECVKWVGSVVMPYKSSQIGHKKKKSISQGTWQVMFSE